MGLLRFSTGVTRMYLALRHAAETGTPFRSKTCCDQFGLTAAECKHCWDRLVELGVVATNGQQILVLDAALPGEHTRVFGELAAKPRGAPVPTFPTWTHFDGVAFPDGPPGTVAWFVAREPIAELHAYANEVLGKRRTLTPGRRAKLQARLKEFSLDQLKQVVDWVAQDPFLRGANDRGRPYDDYATIFANRERVEQYLDAASRTTPKQQLAASDRPPVFHVE